ncbi:MAG: translation initiation factor IF-2 subunit beta [Candidatus Aenigmatarchaeota archaeon]
MEDYEKLLDLAYEKLPKRGESDSRFQIPKTKLQAFGAKTIITNFMEISDILRREPQHIQKFLLKELATAGELESGRLVLQGRFKNDVVDKKIEMYVKEYVLCPDCGKPDTKFIKEDRFLFLKCEVCGSRHVLKKN